MFFSKRRKKQREQRRQRGQFKKKPFKTVKEILDPKPVGELVCTEEELDGHLKQTYGDILVVFPRELQNQMFHLLTPQ